MSIRRFLIALVCLVAATIELYAQDGNNTVFLLSNAAHRYRYNAAYQPEYKSVVSLPVIGGMNFGYMNNSFGLDDIFSLKSNPNGDTLIFSLDNLNSCIKKDLSIHLGMDINMLSVAFKTGDKGYFSIDFSSKMAGDFRFNRGMLDFLYEGNTDYLGETQEFLGASANLSAYAEAAFGYSRVINDQWTVGGRFKVLFGIADIYTKNSSFYIQTGADGESLKFKTDAQYYISAPVDMPLGEFDVELLMNELAVNPALITSVYNNLGFALDLGVTYKLNDDFTLGAAINDLGFINWKNNVYKIESNSEAEWKGVDLSNSINKNDPNYVSVDDAFQNVFDTLKESISVVNAKSSYTRMLKSSFNLHAMYHVHQRFNLSALFRGVMMGDKFYPSMTIGANARPFKNLGLSLTYSIYQGNYANLGVGISPRFGCFQPYLVVDNVLSANALHARNAHVRFGLNFVGLAQFGKRAHKRGKGTSWRAM